jgi:acyl-coenzyme A thioesterase PaaI-like protein
MDSELKQMRSQVVPFNRYLGLEILDAGAGTGSVKLPEGPHLLNHVGSQHAAALFAVAEAASGAAMAGAFADLMAQATPLARSAQISYLKPARGPIIATAPGGTA